MLRRQFFRRTDAVRTAAHVSHGARACSSRSSFGLLAGGLSSMAVNRLKASGESSKNRRSSRTASASRQTVSSMKSDRLLPNASAARSIKPFCFRLARRLIVSLCRVVGRVLVFTVWASCKRNQDTALYTQCKYLCLYLSLIHTERTTIEVMCNGPAARLHITVFR